MTHEQAQHAAACRPHSRGGRHSRRRLPDSGGRGPGRVERRYVHVAHPRPGWADDGSGRPAERRGRRSDRPAHDGPSDRPADDGPDGPADDASHGPADDGPDRPADDGPDGPADDASHGGADDSSHASAAHDRHVQRQRQRRLHVEPDVAERYEPRRQQQHLHPDR
ncbi:hypothetical protein SCOCK_570006 [Actinacidiphila cocklensis]|uniref:Uncharacterized protein n=1 Tax=Actinacidiphila cocklensis TaxID=887465 RepID=A0A9W4DW88_9ACTN|nr:hypothetical protein SCOCK_570006 [Actinacidiphila cocklensis]